MLSPISEKTFFLQVFGCQMNEHDSERIAGMLESLGAVQVAELEESEIVVFVTCCVREAADTRLMGQVASMKNVPLPKGSKLDKRIVCIGGCIGQRDGEKLMEKLAHVDVVFGTQNIDRLPRLIENVLVGRGHQAEVYEASEKFATDLPSKRVHKWAAWLPITSGCNNFCTYCIVPYVRGREKSRPIEDVEREAQALVADGVKEITLLGQNVNSYGRDLYGEPRFADMLRTISATGVERIRFATSHPKDLTDEVISLFGELPNLMPAIHLPVQAGSDRVLKAMNRRYDSAHYRELVRKLREANPDIALSTDIIVGFPGETEEDFQATVELVKEVGYGQVFTFIYSKREGTPAAKIEDSIPREEIQRRFDELVDIVQSGAHEQNQRFTGRTLDVLVEGASKRDDEIIAGRSPHNVTVHAPLPKGKTIEELEGTIVKVRIDESLTWYLAGEVVDA